MKRALQIFLRKGIINGEPACPAGRQPSVTAKK